MANYDAFREAEVTRNWGFWANIGGRCGLDAVASGTAYGDWDKFFGKNCDFFYTSANNVGRRIMGPIKTMPDKLLFTELIRENKGIVFKICNAYCFSKEDRDDLAQEIIYNLWKSFSGYKAEFKFSTWMYRIALNVAISFYRKEKNEKRRIAYSENLLVFEEDSSPNTEEERNLQLLLKFIGELKEIDKSIMLLYLGDKSYKEIAEITGITESNVSTKINRIKEKLKTNFLTNQTNFYGTK